MPNPNDCAWTDEKRGFREETTFLGDEVFAVTNVPLAAPHGIVLICPPLSDDLVRNYRREVVLARRLASRGLVAQRFQYRSTGNSLGEAAPMGWSELLDDARTSLRWASERFEHLPVSFFGTRFGALVATAVASEHSGAPAALWDPVLGVADFVRDVVRIERLVSLSDSDDAPTRTEGSRGADLAMRRLPPRLVEERAQYDLSSIIEQPLGEVLVAKFVGDRDTRLTDKAIGALFPLTKRVEIMEFSGEGSWWPVTRLEQRSIDDAWPLIDATSEWLSNVLVGDRS
jgi:alpha/beta superfamily hydrolase